MLLIRRSRRAATAVRTVSPGGELFVASVVVCMLLSSFGDAVDVSIAGEAGLEFMLFDFAGELSLLAMSQWNLFQLLMAGGALATGIAALATLARALVQSPRPGPKRPVEKVPIRL
ncbi:MAG: hypothetical protein KIT25_21250 [Enhydrobacter sp.]|nr:MAG: hypothetical protein KIT25_21250 [Enhydrobacter sp.]